MLLKQLDTMGFKSFAERIRVDFVSGVTAVVGPNGSGKSNITDAIRWVLGEQSAKSLRGAKMEDIIFQGSDTRKPLNLAEVTLVLDNSDGQLPIDYEEVSVTRRVYRSGESEYLMNKQPCRLKDITELFLDSGLGREAFSIISQGKVEEILSSKSDERRVIFEEAAGVLKYKKRKQQAEYKLAETQENLNRVEDIIYEVEGQVEPLKQQASVAKEYLQLKDLLTENEVGLLVKEMESLHQDWEEVTKNLEQKQVQARESKYITAEKEEELASTREEMQQLDTQITSLQESLLQLTKELEGLEGNKKIFHERMHHFQENKLKLEEEMDLLRNRMEATTNTLEQEKVTLKKYKQKEKENTKARVAVDKKLNAGKSNLEDQIETLKSDYIDLLNDQAAKRNEKNSIRQQLERMETKHQTQSSKWDHLIKERDEFEKRLKQSQLNFKEIDEKLHIERQAYDELKRKIVVENNLYDDMQEKLYKGYQMLENLKSKKEMLEDLKEDFQGFYYGVKEVLKAREQHVLSGIHGAIPELIDFSNDYIDAMETALGAQAQHVVVSDEESARSAIQWLKQTNKGRATFLPITSMQPRSIPSSMLKRLEDDHGFIGVVVDLVSFDKKYEPVLKALLGNVIIAQTLEDANRFAAIMHRRYRIVTLEGDIVNPGGSMSGGAKKKTNQSLFTRDKELKNLKTKYADYQRRVQDFEQKLQNQKQTIHAFEEDRNTKRNTIEELERNYQSQASQLKEWQLSLEHLNDQLAIYDQDKHQREEDQQYLLEKDKELNVQLEELQQKIHVIDQKVEELTKEHANYEEKADQLRQESQQIRIKQAELKTLIANQEEKVDRTQSVLNDIKQSLDEKERQLNQLLELNNGEYSEEELNEQIQKKKQEKIDQETVMSNSREQRNHLSERIQSLELLIKKRTENEYQLSNEMQQLEIQQNRLDVELENRLTILENEYNMTFERAKSTYQKPEDLDKAKEKVKLLKKSIEELGTINLGAIEEYDRIKERYEFLSQQQDDLVEAKRTLYDIIAEMDTEMQRRFEETFTQIKEEFGDVFQRMFGGGKAELRLTDPNQLLETGVEIIAQPPGKKLQQLGLLSGGERALTAIALLFSILRVRPVPFCVLDEVEAALDEANVTRFAEYLKQFSQQTQFIVITHRKGTMEEADVLYGVTMQESGVSRLVSVKLEETPELLEA
ncbi:chromosome segregation protein SMC [Gracilibacillus sp. YIM 98692]|uniref:chromosome segregation protein SMC n=1 Tax=Gracilibacillus sp. YIM 98692 TaxID=2663532 RepID=UPI0013D4531F|nr:chromosome segregation protein SMC [Gracilibacillus sp. YIM 98692]